MPVNISIFLCAGQQFFRWEITMAQYYKRKNKKGMIRNWEYMEWIFKEQIRP